MGRRRSPDRLGRRHRDMLVRRAGEVVTGQERPSRRPSTHPADISRSCTDRDRGAGSTARSSAPGEPPIGASSVRRSNSAPASDAGGSASSCLSVHVPQSEKFVSSGAMKSFRAAVKLSEDRHLRYADPKATHSSSPPGRRSRSAPHRTCGRDRAETVRLTSRDRREVDRASRQAGVGQVDPKPQHGPPWRSCRPQPGSSAQWSSTAQEQLAG